MNREIDLKEEMKTKISGATMMNLTMMNSFSVWWTGVSQGQGCLSWRREQYFQIDPRLKIQTVNFSIKWKRIEWLSTKHSLKMLCDIARVSLSGFYAWKKRKKEHKTKEDREWEDLKQIENLVLVWKRKWGYRMIAMKLAQSDQFSSMNHKKVLRLMKKYNLLSKIRRKNPYKQIRKATLEHSVAPNILNREFQCQMPGEWIWPLPLPYTKLGTDITYIRFKHRWVYFSIVKDMVTGETLSHVLSMTLELTLVQDTYKQLQIEYHQDELRWAISHSDQWFHYTHPSFPNLLKEIWLIQSMSRRWNCVDNAPTESFFGHMKDELDYSHCTTFSELQTYMDEYIRYYNYDRPQWTRKKMTPVQYRNHLLEISKQKHIV